MRLLTNFINTFFIYALFFMIALGCSHSPESAYELKDRKVANASHIDFEKVFCCQDYDNQVLKLWVQEQNQKLRSFLDSEPISVDIKNRVKELNPTNPPAMVEVLGRYFFTKAGSLYIKDDFNSSERVLVQGDPANFNVVGDFKVSPDGKKVAFAKIPRGGDKQFWSVIEISSGQLISGPEIRVRIENVTWDISSSGIFYSRWPESDEDEYEKLKEYKRSVAVWYRPLNSDGSLDQLIFEPQEVPHNMIYAVAELERANVFLAYRTQGPAEIPIMAYLVTKHGHTYKQEKLPLSGQYFGKYLGQKGDWLYFRSTECGDKYGVISYNYKTNKKRVIVPEWNSSTMTAAYFNGSKLVLHYLTDKFENVIKVIDTGTSRVIFEHNFNNEFKNGVAYFSTGFVASPVSTKVFFGGSSFLVSNKTFKLDLASETTRTGVELTQLNDAAQVDFDKSQIEQRLITFRSADKKARIPMWIYSLKGLKEKPKFAYVFFYGAIGTAQSPWWNKKLQIALELGGVVAVPFIRGGGELGRSWTAVAEKDRMKTFSDISAASRYIRQNYSLSAKEIVISARSYGALHVLGAMTFFNNDFGLYFPVVSVSDVPALLTQGLFGQFATDDFALARDNENGSLTNFKADLENLKSWSPFQNINKITEAKPVVFFTAQNDERVGAVQSYKMAHALLEKFGSDAPVYVYTEQNTGHMARAEYADEMSFIAKYFQISKLNRLSIKK